MLNRFILSCCLGLLSLLYSYTASADMNFVEQPDVQDFINMMVKKYHFNQPQLVRLFDSVKIRPPVVQSVKAPMEQQLWSTYRNIFITQARIQQGVIFWNTYEPILAKAEKMYGVPASIIVATIGVETKYGKNKGDYPVIDALATLAFRSSPRAAYFKDELKEFLLLSREQHLNPLTVKGSYAGAIGQPQFMPSSYRRYAVNFSGNSQIDLTNNIPDIIGSVANYYHSHGWKTNQPVTIPTSIEGHNYESLLQRVSNQKPMSQATLASYGITLHRSLPADEKIKLLALKDMYSNEYWLGFHNFEVIKHYNPSNLYAMAVYQLSFYINSLKRDSA